MSVYQTFYLIGEYQLNYLSFEWRRPMYLEVKYILRKVHVFVSKRSGKSCLLNVIQTIQQGFTPTNTHINFFVKNNKEICD